MNNNVPINFENQIASMQTFFKSGATRSFDSRLKALNQLEQMIRENQDEICNALFLDLRKPRQEALISEVVLVLKEIAFAKKNLRAWMKPKGVRTPLLLWPARSRIFFEPLGTVLIIGPWNYPFQLIMAPLVGALAAGNCVVIKPSELTVNTSQSIAKLVAKYFSPDHVKVVEGGINETTSLLNEKFDHIFFTGSTAVGKIIMQAAAKNLTPVTLELGGKSPAIVCEDADLDLAAKRIVWGKFYNSGQTCLAPDYLCVHENIVDSLLEKIKKNILEQFGSDAQKSHSYARIVNERNFSRLIKMIDPKKIISGGRSDQKDLYIEPTVLRDITWSDSIMQEEVFGPILPVMSYSRLEDLFNVINTKPKPLAAYFFSHSKHQQDFIKKVNFGGGCLNDVVVHLSNPHLPFGGIGESGMGKYHGQSSFHLFSHSKSIMYRYGIFDLPARYAPYTEGKLKLLRWLFRV